MDIGSREIVIVAVALLVLFGTKKIPELSKSVAESIRLMRGAFKDDVTSPITKK